jgi:hypothetical protein
MSSVRLGVSRHLAKAPAILYIPNVRFVWKGAWEALCIDILDAE